ncbi:hypothetical protein [Bradyrhizobium sp. LB11.1]|uniref:hypothetical protein n=1 Tax=Bradyrhizobium sp. LB11.1 TaxID=3156326 RepID=UPI003391180A
MSDSGVIDFHAHILHRKLASISQDNVLLSVSGAMPPLPRVAAARHSRPALPQGFRVDRFASRIALSIVSASLVAAAQRVNRLKAGIWRARQILPENLSHAIEILSSQIIFAAAQGMAAVAVAAYQDPRFTRQAFVAVGLDPVMNSPSDFSRILKTESVSAKAEFRAKPEYPFVKEVIAVDGSSVFNCTGHFVMVRRQARVSDRYCRAGSIVTVH